MYKINIKYGYENINDILIKVLKKNINNYLKKTCNLNAKELTSSYTYLSTKVEEDRSGR